MLWIQKCLKEKLKARRTRAWLQLHRHVETIMRPHFLFSKALSWKLPDNIKMSTEWDARNKTWLEGHRKMTEFLQWILTEWLWKQNGELVFCFWFLVSFKGERLKGDVEKLKRWEACLLEVSFSLNALIQWSCGLSLFSWKPTGALWVWNCKENYFSNTHHLTEVLQFHTSGLALLLHPVRDSTVLWNLTSFSFTPLIRNIVMMEYWYA